MPESNWTSNFVLITLTKENPAYQMHFFWMEASIQVNEVFQTFFLQKIAILHSKRDHYNPKWMLGARYSYLEPHGDTEEG